MDEQFLNKKRQINKKSMNLGKQYENINKIKDIVLLFSMLLTLLSCSSKNDFDNVVASKYLQCENNSVCLIDFSSSMWFQWDTMCYYSGGNSLDEINDDLGFELKEFIDVGDRVVFLNKGMEVYQKYWSIEPSEPRKGVVFLTDLKIMKLTRSESKFIIKKQGDTFYLVKY